MTECVKENGQPAPTTVIGNLEWQTKLSDLYLSWEGAAEYAKSLGDGWRVPTRTELLTLVDDTKRDPACSVFPEDGTMPLWTSTRYARDPANWIWTVFFTDGMCVGMAHTERCKVRCVRTVETK